MDGWMACGHTACAVGPCRLQSWLEGYSGGALEGCSRGTQRGALRGALRGTPMRVWLDHGAGPARTFPAWRLPCQLLPWLWSGQCRCTRGGIRRCCGMPTAGWHRADRQARARAAAGDGCGGDRVRDGHQHGRRRRSAPVRPARLNPARARTGLRTGLPARARPQARTRRCSHSRSRNAQRRGLLHALRCAVAAPPCAGDEVVFLFANVTAGATGYSHFP